MRRTSFATLATLLALTTSTTAQAQSQGTIYFSVQGGMHSVDGNGTNYTPLPVESGRASGLSYPNGRLFLSRPQVGPIPNHPTGAGYADVIANDVAGGGVQVTNFRGPLWVLSAAPAKWSNDLQDTFISFSVYDSVSGRYGICRAWVTGLGIASPGFVPLTMDDTLPGGRLELVLDTADRQVPVWNGDGTKFVYATAEGVRMHFIASGPSPANDLLILSKAATGLTPGDLTYSPVTEQIAGYGKYTSGKTTVEGIFSLNPLAQNNWRWIRTQYSTKTTTLTRTTLGGVVFSPDGNWVAYQGAYSGRGFSTFSALIKSPAASTNLQETIVSSNPPGDQYASRLISGWCW